LSEEEIQDLERQIEIELSPVIKSNKKFNLLKVFHMYNKLFEDNKKDIWEFEIRWGGDQDRNGFMEELFRGKGLWIARVNAKKITNYKTQHIFKFNIWLFEYKNFIETNSEQYFLPWILHTLEEKLFINTFLSLPKDKDGIRHIIFDTPHLDKARRIINTNEIYKSEVNPKDKNTFTFSL